MSNLVEIRDLRVDFPTTAGFTHAVRGVSFSLGREKLGIVGESGSGKSVTGRALMRLLPEAARVRAGALRFDGIDVLNASERQMRGLRGGRIGLVMQDPKFSLNPVMTIGRQIAEAWLAHQKGGQREAREAALNLLEQVRIRDPRRVLDSYPHEVSGGMAQRILIAGAVSCDPELIIADEPTSSLDVTVQAEVLDLLRDLQRERGLALLLVTHNFGVVADLCDRVAVMRSGEIVEEGEVAEVLDRPQHEYTRSLLAAILDEDGPARPALTAVGR